MEEVDARPDETSQARPSSRRRLGAVLAAAFLLVAGTIGVWALLSRGGSPGLTGRSAKLNVLLITLDTTRADYLGCYGRTDARTPCIDRLAREGVLFTQCSAGIPQTLPSHCSIMTGQYPYVHGVRRNGADRLDAAAVTLAEMLKPGGFTAQATIAFFGLNRRFGISQGFEVYHEVLSANSAQPGAGERGGGEVCDDALAMLRELSGRPFFLWVHLFDPHHPYRSSRTPDVDSLVAYADEIAFMDEQIGRLTDGLRRLGLDKTTLVALVGDHGEGLHDHDEFQHGFFLFETTLRVPLIFRCPGLLPEDRRIDALVRTIDVAPTILDLVGAPPLPDAQGVSLAPLLRGQTASMDLDAYGETTETHAVFRLSCLRSLSADGWKYILAPRPRLYHLPSDPRESRNLIAEQPEKAENMRQRLRQLIAAAPPPLAPGSASTQLAPEEVRQLQALGYVGTVSATDDGGESELDRFEPQGPDPHDFAGTIESATRAHRAMGKGEFTDAERRLREVIRALPGAPELNRDLAFTLERQSKIDEACEAYKRCLIINPDDLPTRSHYVTLLMDHRRFAEAVEQLEWTVSKTPDDFTTRSLLGIACGSLKRFDEAARHFEVAVRIKPGDVQTLHALGIVYQQQDRLREAADCFRKALELNPQFFPARESLKALEQESRG